MLQELGVLPTKGMDCSQWAEGPDKGEKNVCKTDSWSKVSSSQCSEESSLRSSTQELWGDNICGKGILRTCGCLRHIGLHFSQDSWKPMVLFSSKHVWKLSNAFFFYTFLFQAFGHVCAQCFMYLTLFQYQWNFAHICRRMCEVQLARFLHILWLFLLHTFYKCVYQCQSDVNLTLKPFSLKVKI